MSPLLSRTVLPKITLVSFGLVFGFWVRGTATQTRKRRTIVTAQSTSNESYVKVCTWLRFHEPNLRGLGETRELRNFADTEEEVRSGVTYRNLSITEISFINWVFPHAGGIQCPSYVCFALAHVLC